MRRSAAFLGLSAALACADDPLLQQAQPSLALTVTELDFGPIAEGTTATRVLPLQNAGPVSLTITLGLQNADEQWALEVTGTTTVAAVSTRELAVRFTPRGPGSDTAEITLTSNDPQHPSATVRLRGGPIAPRLDVSPDPLDFAPATSARTTRPAAIKNVGLATLHLTDVHVDVDANPDFALRAPPASMTLGPASETEIIVDYTRSARGAAGRLIVRSDDPDVPELAVRLLPDPLAACADGADNDGDRLVDFPDDPGCTSATDGDEANPPECTDGMTMPCGTDAGECELGTRTCVGTTWGPCVQPRGPVDELCNGLDDDCDQRVDEALSETCTTNGCSGARACVEGGAGTWTACIAATAVAETCNGLDDDCDGTVDDGIVQTCVVNGCMGQQICVPGGMGELTACQVATQPETCNGLDDDCNGAPDDGIPDVACGMGACRRVVPACTATGQPNTCVPGTPGVEVCNGVDDDCDGTPDNLTALSCGVGQCARTAVACLSGTDNMCVPGAPMAELCNGLDDDCNNVPDDRAPITCGRGACARTVAACANGADNTCVPGAPGVETCNGLDDDCNGVPDDLPAISCGRGQCLRTVAACMGGAPNTCTPGAPAAESCNGLDDNCDGTADNLPAITCGQGVCQRTVAACSGGAPNTCVPGTAGTEICNGLDDNCNGTPDEGGVCGAACGPMNTAPDAQEPNNTATSARPTVAWTANGTFNYEYDLTLPSGDNDWFQYNFPPVGAATFAQLTAQVLCVSWAGAGCGSAATVGLEAWYVDDFGSQIDGSNAGTSGLALVTSSGPVASFFPLNQRFRVRAYPSAAVCTGEAISARVRVTVTWSM